MTHSRGSMATPKQAVFIGILVLLIGIGIAVASGNYEYTFYTTYQQSQKAIGHVVRLDIIGQTYHPVMEFTGEYEKTFQSTDPQGSKPAQYEIGEEVQMAYPKFHPEKGRIDSVFTTWVTPFMPLACSAFWLATGIIFLFNGISRLRKHNSWNN